MTPLSLPAHILIVDDEEAVRLVLQEMLGMFGYVCRQAADGVEALEVLREQDFDVIFVDLLMPKGGGLRFLAALRETKSQAVPIALTGLQDVDSAVEAMKLGAFDYLSKPPDPGELQRITARAVEFAHARQHGQIMERLAAEWEVTFDACPDPIVIVDFDFRILRCNQALVRRLRLPKERIVGRPFSEFLEEGGQSRILCACSRAILHNALQTEEITDAQLGGVFRVTATPIDCPEGPLCCNTCGRPCCAVCVVRDITEYKRAEEKLAGSLLRERQARAKARAAHKRASFLAKASMVLATSGDYRAAIREVIALAVPYLADWCFMELVEPNRWLRLVYRHRQPFEAKWVVKNASLLPVDPATTHPILQVLLHCRPKVLHDFSMPLLLEPPGGTAKTNPSNVVVFPSGMIVPLSVRGIVRGALTFVTTESNRRFTPEDLELAEDLACRIAAAADNACLLAETRKYVRDLQSLALQLSTTEDRERRRLALEIHDSIGQMLSAIKMNLEKEMDAIREKCPNARAPRSDDQEPSDECPASAQLAATKGLMEAVIEQTRSMTFDLYPAMLDDLGLVPALRWYGEQFRERTGIDVIVSEGGPPLALPPSLAAFLFRAAKELLNNVAKHAQAGEAVLSVHWHSERVRIVAADDGRGFDVAKTSASSPRGLGLIGIRERLLAMGGQFNVESLPARGTQIILEAPVGPSEPEA